MNTAKLTYQDNYIKISNFIYHFVRDLSNMFDFKVQRAELNDICYGSSVYFEMNKTGHIEIRGEIFGEAMEHCLKFSFDADQSVLKQFISDLQDLINN